MNTAIGSKLKKIRKQKGWSQEIVADKLHISQSAYARIETGESNSWANHLETICSVFEIQPEELFKQDSLVINNNQQGGGGFVQIVNQLSDKVIEQYEARLKDKEEIIKIKDTIISELKAKQ